MFVPNRLFVCCVEHLDAAVVVVVVNNIGGGDRFDVSFRFAYNFSVCAHTIFAFLVIDSAVELHGTSGQVDWFRLIRWKLSGIWYLEIEDSLNVYRYFWLAGRQGLRLASSHTSLFIEEIRGKSSVGDSESSACVRYSSTHNIEKYVVIHTQLILDF